MQTFEIGHLRRITGFDEHFKSGLNERARAAAKHGLFAEQIGFGLFLEVGFEDAGAGAADAFGPSERNLLRILAGILINGDEARHALAFGVLAADGVAGAFRRDHDDVHVLRRNNGLEMNRETVREHQRLALGQIWLDVLLVALRLLGVGQRDHDDVGLPHGFCGGDNLKTLFLRDGNGFAAFVKSDDDRKAAVFEVERVGVTLRAEAEDRQRFVLQHAEVGVFVGIDF